MDIVDLSPTYKKRAVFFNGGKESLIVLHKYMYNSVIVCVDSDNDFPELVEYVDLIAKKYDISILKFLDMKTSIIALKKEGIDLVIIGCRNTDPNCGNLNVYQETDNNWPKIMRFHPLLNWTYSDVWNYIEDNNLPVCSLYETGYTSIGDKTNTFPNYALFDGIGYKPAKYLVDDTTERMGRISSKLPYIFNAKIIRGKGLGRKLGYPTANLDTVISIDEGIYYGYVNFMDDPREYKMVMSTGTNFQFGDVSTEIHILGIPDEDFYGRFLKVNVVGFLRKMMKYESIEKLVDAIQMDIKIAKYHLSG